MKDNSHDYFTIHPPKGCRFVECEICEMPMVYNEEFPSDICLMCELKKQEEEDE